jgi:acyl-CoA thioesterase
LSDTNKETEKDGAIKTFLNKIEGEPIASFFNFKILELTPGFAKVSMKVKDDYVNFNGVVFGSIVMAIADYAFSLASNSLVMPSLATQFNIHLLAAAEVGDELICEGKTIKSGRRVGISEMIVTNQSGKLIARATGTTIPVNTNH